MNELPTMPTDCHNCGRPDISTDSCRWFCECGWSTPITGYWRKLPCPNHTEQFDLECAACNAKNAEWVQL